MKSINLTEKDVREIIKKQILDRKSVFISESTGDAQGVPDPISEPDPMSFSGNSESFFEHIQEEGHGVRVSWSDADGGPIPDQEMWNQMSTLLSGAISSDLVEINSIDIIGATCTDDAEEAEDAVSRGQAYADMAVQLVQQIYRDKQLEPVEINTYSIGNRCPSNTNRTTRGRAANNRTIFLFNTSVSAEGTLGVHNIKNIMSGQAEAEGVENPWGGEGQKPISAETVVSGIRPGGAIWLGVPPGDETRKLVNGGDVVPTYRLYDNEWIRQIQISDEQARSFVKPERHSELDAADSESIIFISPEFVNSEAYPVSGELLLLKADSGFNIVGGLSPTEMDNIVGAHASKDTEMYAYGFDGDDMSLLDEIYGPPDSGVAEPGDRVAALGQEQPELPPEPTRLFTVQNRGGTEIFTIRMPASFVNSAGDGQWARNARGWIDDIFNPDVLNDFRNQAGKADLGETDFRLSWNRFSNSTMLHFVVKVDILDIDSINYEEGLPFRRIPRSDGYDGVLRKAYNYLLQDWRAARREIRSSDPEEERQGRIKSRIALSLMEAMRNSTYDNLKVKTRNGDDISLWRWTPRNLGNTGISPRQMNKIEEIYIENQEAGSVNESARDLIKIIKNINEIGTSRSFGDTRPFDARVRYRSFRSSGDEGTLSAQSARLARLAGVGGAVYLLSDPNATTVVPVFVDGDIQLSSRAGVTRGHGEHAYRHGGDDIAVPTGTPVIASAAGTVVSTREPTEVWDPENPGNPNASRGGCSVTIQHNIDGQTVRTFYGHLSRIFVRSGRVRMGQQIGETGGQRGTPCGGNTTGPHLHFEIQDAAGNSVLDPTVYDQWYNDASTLDFSRDVDPENPDGGSIEITAPPEGFEIPRP